MSAEVSASAGSSGTIRRWVAQHPVTVMVVAMLGIGYALLIPPALAGVPLEGPFLLASILFGQLLPAVLVTAAVGGRAGVRELFGRVFRWRVHPGWYAVAFLGIPVAALLGSAVAFGGGALRALVTDPAVITTYLLQLTILPLVNLWEETAVMGVIQDRLARRRGPLLGAAFTAPVFALTHLPLRLGPPVGEVVVGMLALIAISVPFRALLGWLYERTGRSILLVAIAHVTFNATNNNNLLGAAAPDRPDAVALVPWVVVVVGGVLVSVLDRRMWRRPVVDTGRADAPADDNRDPDLPTGIAGSG